MSAALECLPVRDVELTVPFADVSETFWWPRRVYASRANVAGYHPKPRLLRTLITNVAIDSMRGRLEPTGGPIVALCADLDRFLVSLNPPDLAAHGTDLAEQAGVPIVQLGGWFRSGARLERVIPAEGVRPGLVEDAARRLETALRFLEQLDQAWDRSFASIVAVGWPVYARREAHTRSKALLDACTGHAILIESG